LRDSKTSGRLNEAVAKKEKKKSLKKVSYKLKSSRSRSAPPGLANNKKEKEGASLLGKERKKE